MRLQTVKKAATPGGGAEPMDVDAAPATGGTYAPSITLVNGRRCVLTP